MKLRVAFNCLIALSGFGYLVLFAPIHACAALVTGGLVGAWMGRRASGDLAAKAIVLSVCGAGLIATFAGHLFGEWWWSALVFCTTLHAITIWQALRSEEKARGV